MQEFSNHKAHGDIKISNMPSFPIPHWGGGECRRTNVFFVSLEALMPIAVRQGSFCAVLQSPQRVVQHIPAVIWKLVLKIALMTKDLKQNTNAFRCKRKNTYCAHFTNSFEIRVGRDENRNI